MNSERRDHGGRLALAISHYGGQVEDWIDLSTGINPRPFDFGSISKHSWTRLPEEETFEALYKAARSLWQVPEEATVLATNGASAAIAAMPYAFDVDNICIPEPTYNEHAAAFRAAKIAIVKGSADAQVVVNPNNPTGKCWSADELLKSHRKLTIIDESFCDTCPANSLVDLTKEPGFVVLKSFGKFWGLAGLRLGFTIGTPETLARLRQVLGPWQVSGPALEISTKALNNHAWAAHSRTWLETQRDSLDTILQSSGGTFVGGTDLFRTYEFENANSVYDQLANAQILVRVFPYSAGWIRFGIPENENELNRLARALA